MQPLIPYFEPVRIPLFGDLAIQAPGLLLVLAFVLGHYVALRKARRDGLEAALVHRLFGWAVLGVIVGGHLGYLLFYEPAELLADPRALFRVWRGQSSYGGFLACGLLGLWFYRRENRRRAASPGRRPIDAWAYADAELYGFTVGWFLARVGCFSVHDHPGIQTDFWLGVQGICPGGPPAAACHDLGLYEAIWSLVAFAVFTWLDRRPRFPGFVTGVLLVAYGASRFLLDFLRHPLIDARYLGLTPGHYGSVLLLVLGLWILRRQRRKRPVRPLLTATP